MGMGDLARLPRPDEDGSDSYDVPMGSLLAPQRNPAMPPQSVVDLFTPNLSRPETYAPRSADLVPNAAGKIPTSDPLSTGAAADLANMAGYAIPFGGPAAAATKLALPLLAVGRRLVPAAEEAANAASIATGIRAYHSSPHDFEKFDFSPARARSGEGAQVYGEGGYFAENPAVSGQGGQYWNQFKDRFRGTPEGDAAEYLRRAGFDRDAAVAMVNKDIADVRANPAWHGPGTEAGIKQLEQRAKLLESGKPVGPRTYEVKIKAKPEEMLDWEKPLGQQSPYTQQAIEAIASSNAAIGSRIAALDRLGKASGTNIYSAISRGANPEMMAPESRALASNTLREAGIPGVSYLDQGSRVQADRIRMMENLLASQSHPATVASLQDQLAFLKRNPLTSNYVMFPGNEHLVDIMKKYGMAGAVPAMGSLADTSYREQ